MRGSRLAGVGVAGALVAGLTLLPLLVLAGFYTFANVYALVVGARFSSDAANVGVLAAGLAVTVAGLLVLLALGLGLIGRSLSPRRRDRGDPGDFEEGPIRP